MVAVGCPSLLERGEQDWFRCNGRQILYRLDSGKRAVVTSVAALIARLCSGVFFVVTGGGVSEDDGGHLYVHYRILQVTR